MGEGFEVAFPTSTGDLGSFHRYFTSWWHGRRGWFLLLPQNSMKDLGQRLPIPIIKINTRTESDNRTQCFPIAPLRIWLLTRILGASSDLHPAFRVTFISQASCCSLPVCLLVYLFRHVSHCNERKPGRQDLATSACSVLGYRCVALSSALVTSQPVWDTRDPMNEVNGMFKCSREGLKEVSLLGPFPSWAIPAHSQNLFLSLSPEGSSLQLVSHNTSLGVGLRIP